MHIPDGYLSPETCGVLYAASAPFWYTSLRKLRSLSEGRALPLVAVFASFCFVVMMFNLPLPGGTTGHAVGMGIASIILGPWASILAISVALTIQALLFGDGGITAIGANCFNMAIVGSLVSYGTYRALAFRSGLRSRRRVVAAAFAGYAAINVAAFCAAVEFGLQPLLFHDPHGVPLYCPYPLAISIPAMMIGHLTFAGLAELVITGGVVAYFQQSEPAMLVETASDAPDRELPSHDLPALPPLRNLRRLWIALAALLILTPLGILAGGSAWGEWTAADFSDSATRASIAAASHAAPPAQVPQGLARLADLWNAPLPRYAPGWMGSPYFGYLASAAVGTGVLILLFLALGAFFERRPDQARSASATWLERSLETLVRMSREALFADDIARAQGVLQAAEPRVKLAGIASLLLAAIFVRHLWAVIVLWVIAVTLALFSSIGLRRLAVSVWLPALLFTGPIALPAIFLTSGPVMLRLPWIGWTATMPGIMAAALLLARVETAATLSAALILTTEWTRILRALRLLRIPATAVVILGMTHRFLFLTLRTATEMLEARRVRLVGTLAPTDRRRMAAGSAGVLLSKSLQLSAEVHEAMRARGFGGEIYFLEDEPLDARSWGMLFLFLAAAAALITAGR